MNQNMMKLMRKQGNWKNKKKATMKMVVFFKKNKKELLTPFVNVTI